MLLCFSFIKNIFYSSGYHKYDWNLILFKNNNLLFHNLTNEEKKSYKTARHAIIRYERSSTYDSGMWKLSLVQS